MATVTAVKESVKQALKQIKDFKVSLSNQVSNDIAKQRDQLAKLELPWNDMRREMDLLNLKISDLTEECNQREIQHEVIDQKVAFAMKKIKDLETQKCD